MAYEQTIHKGKWHLAIALISLNDGLSDSKQEKVNASLMENLSFGLTKATVTAMNTKQLVQYIAILFDGMRGIF